MAEAIFLSASVPDPQRFPDYAATADSVAIAAAVSALVHIALGRRQLIWGGHPAITPMVWAVAENVGVDYGRWVRLYQSRFFKDEFPEDNNRFQNVTYTEAVENDRAASLLVMREKMFSENDFKAGIFVGGMDGIVDEFKLFKRLQPNATIVPVVSTGGAVLEVAKLMQNVDSDLADNLDYVAVLHRHLGISNREERFKRPEEQPASVEARYWRAPDMIKG